MSYSSLMGKNMYIYIYIQCCGDILLQSHLSLDVNFFTRLIRLCIIQVLLDDTWLFYGPCSCDCQYCSLVTNAVHKINQSGSVKKLVSRVFLPVVHSISGEPLVPGGHRQTNIAPSLMHSAFLPHPFVRQSPKSLSELPVSTNH